MNKSFKDKSFSDRIKEMGDLAEGKFTSYCAINDYLVVPFGWNRPNLKYFVNLPTAIKYMPDRVVEIDNHHWFVEVKGCGKDQIFKIKQDNLNALRWWNGIMPVKFAMYNHQSSGMVFPVSHQHISELCKTAKRKSFPDNNKMYYEISPTEFEGWIRV